MTDSVEKPLSGQRKRNRDPDSVVGIFLEAVKLQMPCQLYCDLPESYTDFLAISTMLQMSKKTD